MLSLSVLLIVVLVFITIFRKVTPKLLGHWNTLISDFQFSTQEFYAHLSEELQAHGLDDIYLAEKEFLEGGILSGKRLYLRVSWREYNYDCCLAPFGDSTFASWWLFGQKGAIESFVSRIPFIGNFLSNMFFPTTYYMADTSSMFMKFAHASVLKVIDEITKESGTRALTEEEKKPLMADIFKR